MLHLVLDFLIDLSIELAKSGLCRSWKLTNNCFIEIEEYLLKRGKGAAAAVVKVGVCITDESIN